MSIPILLDNTDNVLHIDRAPLDKDTGWMDMIVEDGASDHDTKAKGNGLWLTNTPLGDGVIADTNESGKTLGDTTTGT